MAACAQRQAQCLSRFCKLAVIYLLVLSLFTPNSFAYLSYTHQELLDIGLHNSDNFIGDLQLNSEIIKTPEAINPGVLAGGVESINKSEGREEG